MSDPSVLDYFTYQRDQYEGIPTFEEQPALISPSLYSMVFSNLPVCQSDQLQQPDRLVQTIYGTPLNVESEFDRSAIWTTEADDVERPAAKSPPIQSQ